MSRHIPKALREACWIKIFGKIFETKCYISWCPNTINVFNFECGHDNPHSKGGVTALDNLYPICARCNKSMSDSYTIEEWNKLGESVSASELHIHIKKVTTEGEKKRKKDSPDREPSKKIKKTSDICTESKISKCIIM